ncbi:MAG: hypothetical protein OXB95_02115 [Rhodobacteraceae bacterium]|nr:hypothetical protein [Paracoccaceae bacterium]
MYKIDEINEFWQKLPTPFMAPWTNWSAAVKESAGAVESATKISLTAASETAAISEKWAKSSLENLKDLSSARDTSANYAEAFQNFASKSMEAATENMFAYAEVVQRSQRASAKLAKPFGNGASGSQ